MDEKKARKLDYRMKWALLVVSVVTLGFLVAAALRENVFPEWRRIRTDYVDILENKADDERGEQILAQYEVKLEQNVLADLNRVDRCITCHPGANDPRMTDVPQPFRKHPGNYIVDHPPAQFGCTICHRGQGRAVVFEEAKAIDEHWNYPMLPVELTASSCGFCHSPEEVEETGGAKYAWGKLLFEEKGCYSCHKLSGRGGSLGPALDNEGRKVPAQMPMVNVEGSHTLPQWQIEHFRDPQKIVDNSQMPPPQLSDEENEALTAYMLSLQERQLPSQYLSPEKHLAIYQLARPQAMSGEDLYNRFCSRCHRTGEYGHYDKFFQQFTPAIRGPSYTAVATEDYLTSNILKGHPETIMPAWAPASGGLRVKEIARLAEYLLEAKPEEQVLPPGVVANAKDPSYTIAGDPATGGEIFVRHCSACHGENGEGLIGPSLRNRVFQQAATDGLIYATIAYGRRNTVMPGFLAPDRGGFAEEAIRNTVAHVRVLGPGGKRTPQTNRIASASDELNELE